MRAPVLSPIPAAGNPSHSSSPSITRAHHLDVAAIEFGQLLSGGGIAEGVEVELLVEDWTGPAPAATACRLTKSAKSDSRDSEGVSVERNVSREGG